MLASINTPHPNGTVLRQHKANQFSLIKHQMNPVWATKQLQTLAPQTHNGLCSVKKKINLFHHFKTPQQHLFNKKLTDQ